MCFLLDVYGTGTWAKASVERFYGLVWSVTQNEGFITKAEGLTNAYLCAIIILVFWSKRGASVSVAQYRNSEVYPSRR